MSTGWRDYQHDAAAFFESLKLTALVEHKIVGARGVHKIDVYIVGDYLGISFTWIVECKYWKTNVTKEKVMSLAAIIQDTGADRGFLLSEKGFQSGAIQAARKSNITLTSLEDLAVTVGARVLEAKIADVRTRIHNVCLKLRAYKDTLAEGEWDTLFLTAVTTMSCLSYSIDEAVQGQLPTPYLLVNGDRKWANSLEELLEASELLVREVERVNLETARCANPIGSAVK